MKATQIKTEKSHILYDADCLGQVDDDFFEPGHWDERQLLRGGAPGRGTTVFVQHGDAHYALRHYHRGGLPARISRDRYLWWGLEQTRPWREWRLLAELHRRGLSVPKPVAARVMRQGLSYRADILTEVLPGRPLADWLHEQRLPAIQLEQLGLWLRGFHQQGVFHADLNARNILLDDESHFYLLDFDRGALREPTRGWRYANMARLQRSLQKFRRTERNFAFDDEDWKAIMRGYEVESV